jgi:ribosomal protein S18 acetylase RimI-like enzyme
MTGIVHRDAVPADATLMAEIGRRTFAETFGHLYSPENLAAFLANHNEANWRAELEDPAFSVRIVEADGEPIGYAKIGPPSLPFDPRGPSAELRQIYVLDPWQGRGIAQELMAWAIGEARKRGARDLYLSVFVDNHRARRFYERYGFTFVGTYAFMVGDHEDEDHVLRLALDEE